MTLDSFLPLSTVIFCLGCKSQQETGRFHSNSPGEEDLSTRLPIRILVVFSRILLGFIVKMWRRVPDHPAVNVETMCAVSRFWCRVWRIADARFQPFTLISSVSPQKSSNIHAIHYF